MEGKMSKNILIIAFVSFIIGSLFGFALVKELQTTPPPEKAQTVTGSVKFLTCLENKTPLLPPETLPPPPEAPLLSPPEEPSRLSETPQEETRNATDSLEKYWRELKKMQCGIPDSVPVENVLLAIVGQNGKIIKTTTTDKNGEAEPEITVPVDPLFNINPKWPSERGVIHIVSFKKGYVETVLFNVPVFPGKWQIDENIIYDIPLRLLNPDPYQRNAPISIDRGGLKTWHRLEVDGFISSVAEALNLKAAYY